MTDPQGQPRVPLPAEAVHLRAGAARLDPERPVAGVAEGQIHGALRVIAAVRRAGGGLLRDEDRALTAGWGTRARAAPPRLGRGRAVERDLTPDERVAIEAGAAAAGPPPEAGRGARG